MHLRIMPSAGSPTDEAAEFRRALADLRGLSKHARADRRVYSAHEGRHGGLCHRTPQGFRRLDRADTGLRWNAAAAAVLLLTCLTALLSWRTPSSEPRTIVLDAYRGAAFGGAGGKAARPENRLEGCTASGGLPGRNRRCDGPPGMVRRDAGALTKGLAPGVYWVRLSTDTGEAAARIRSRPRSSRSNLRTCR